MTVPVQIPFIQYTSNGLSASFEYPFMILQDGDVEVWVDQTRMTLTDDYTVSGAGELTGGDVTFVSTPTSGKMITLVRNMAMNRNVDYATAGALRAEDLDSDLDQRVLADQQFQNEKLRSVRISAGSYTAENLELNVAASDRANQALGFDSNGALTTLPIALSELSAEMFIGHSSTSLSIGTGTMSLTVESSKGFAQGQTVIVSSVANSANYMVGTVTSYDVSSGALVVSAASAGGSGTIASWIVSLSGPQGASGAGVPSGTAGQIAYWATSGTNLSGTNTLPSGTGASDFALTGTLGMKSLSETYSAPTISSNTLTINLANGSVFNVTMNAAITTFTISNAPASKASSFLIVSKGDGTARSQTWGSSVKWSAGSAPTLTATNGKVDFLFFLTNDGGTTWFGFVPGQNF